ncbi:replication initiation protein [Bacillus salitolerans]|uniref:Replication initiation protein n=1 Tax=Bacillus salitolerans TaxID=1437434 RepID=A0ABW4LM81_9BACI
MDRVLYSKGEVIVMAKSEQLSWEEELTTRISPEYIVSQSNRLIETPQDLNLQERRIILTLASLIQPDDEDFRLHRIKVKDLADILGIQEKNYYRKVREIVVGLQQKMLRIATGEKELLINWLSSSEYFMGEGVVELEFSTKLRPFLVQLKNEYTPFKLRNVLRLRSEYSMRMYELLKQYEKIHKREISYAKLRYYLCIPDDKYEQYGHFKSKVLLKAQEELKEKTDISFSFDELKRGRKVVGFNFYINSNTHFIEDVANKEEFKDDPYGMLVRFGVRPQKAKELTVLFSQEHILGNVKYVVKDKGKENIDNISGYIIKAIEGNYAEIPSPSQHIDVPTVEEINKKIHSYAFFMEQKVKEQLLTKEGAKQELKKYCYELFIPIIEIRRENGLEPISDSSIDNLVAKQTYRIALKKN